jgi:hypothetical protein
VAVGLVSQVSRVLSLQLVITSMSAMATAAATIRLFIRLAQYLPLKETR